MFKHGWKQCRGIGILFFGFLLSTAVLSVPIDSDTSGDVTNDISIGTQVTFTMGVTVDNDSNLTPNNIKVSDSLTAEFEFS